MFRGWVVREYKGCETWSLGGRGLLTCHTQRRIRGRMINKIPFHWEAEQIVYGRVSKLAPYNIFKKVPLFFF